MRFHNTPTHPLAAEILADDAAHRYLDKYFYYCGQQMTESNVNRAEGLSHQESKTRLMAYNILKHYRYNTADKDFLDKVHDEILIFFANFIAKQREGLKN